MSRGKKAKRKIGGRRKQQEAAVVAATLRLSDADGSSVIPINQSRTHDLSTTIAETTKTTPMNALCRKAVKNDDLSRNLVPTGSHRELSAKSDHLCCSGSFTIFFKSDELQTLRSVLHKTDLSRTPVLLGAIILGKADVVERLLRDGYPINSRSEEDKTTALMWAVRNKDLEMINLLVRHGADLTLLDENNDNVALIAVQSSSWEQNDFLDFWNSIDRKIDLTHANIRGNTILHYAKERRWDVLANLIGTDPRASRRKDAEKCFCCFCSSSMGDVKYKNKGVFSPDEMESTLSHLTVLFDEIVNRYRETWSRDRNLGYPGFRGGHGDSAATIEDLMRLRREEIARLNTILPKLEESYLQKLRDCWSSIIAKMRQTAARDWKKFHDHVTSIQIQLLTHEVCPKAEEHLEFYTSDNNNRPGSFLEVFDDGSSHRNFNVCS